MNDQVQTVIADYGIKSWNSGYAAGIMAERANVIDKINELFNDEIDKSELMKVIESYQ
jgi:hypothetical protein